MHTRRVKGRGLSLGAGQGRGRCGPWSTGQLESRMGCSLCKRLKDYHRGGRENNDADNDHKDAEDQGADIQALGSGGVGLGSTEVELVSRIWESSALRTGLRLQQPGSVRRE